MPMVRGDETDLIYKTEDAKFSAVVDDISERHEAGQPVLVGTASVAKSERLSSLLLRRGHGSVEGQIGTVYVLAGAWSILLLATNPLGEHGLLDMLKGEIIAVSDMDLRRTAAAFGTVALLLILFQKEFLLVSFDREMAITLKKNVPFWDSLLFLLIGLTISMAVLSVGPMVAFGFLLIPPLIAHLLARNMRQFALVAAGIGGLSALVGFYIAFRWDYPVGPTDVALLGFLYAIAFVVRKVYVRFRKAAVPA